MPEPTPFAYTFNADALRALQESNFHGLTGSLYLDSNDGPIAGMWLPRIIDINLEVRTNFEPVSFEESLRSNHVIYRTQEFLPVLTLKAVLRELHDGTQ